MKDSARFYRAVRNLSVEIENDPEPMVQQQLARLRFMLSTLPLRDARVLEFGCGSGLNSAYLAENARTREVTGFDFSALAVELARTQYPQFTFLVADGCDPKLDIERGTWDVVFSTEVLEHVPDMNAFMANIRSHLSPDGVAFISTPNREVFSCGHEPSPINKEHVKELNLIEFTDLIARHFDHRDVYCQRFKELSLRAKWKEETLQKIELLNRGTRWDRKPSVSSRLRTIPLVNAAYGYGPIRETWKRFRHHVIDPIQLRRQIDACEYTWRDFEFTKDHEDTLWLCAIVR